MYIYINVLLDCILTFYFFLYSLFLLVEESSEFLGPTETLPPQQMMPESNRSTVLYSDSNNAHFMYNRVHWTLNIRKEVRGYFHYSHHISKTVQKLV